MMGSNALFGTGIGSDVDQLYSITLFVALLSACIVIGHLLEENRWINESITALLIGLCSGIVILLTTNGKSSRILEFDEQLFFIYLLPPIIFNAGFQVKKKQFFRNFMTIVLFGVVGTLISFCIISFGAKSFFANLDIGSLELQDYLAIGAIFSATDSVCTLQVLNQDDTPLLYSLVFGEGVVNDATSVVLFNAIQRFDLSHVKSKIAAQFMGNFLTLFITSTFLGIVIGLLCAYLIKKLYLGRHSTDREVALMMLMAYLSYVMSEMFNLSGILTVFFCGIVMSHYTWHNVTQSSRTTTRHAFATLSFVAEAFIFLYVGMDALDIEKWKFVSESPGKSIAASAVLFGLVLVGRASFIFPLSFLSNFTKKSKSDKFDLKQQVTIWWAGLMRGAVSMALAYNQFARSGHTQQPGNAIMITSTITVVLFSTIVFGLMTKPLLKFLLPQSIIPEHGMESETAGTRPILMPLLDDEENVEVGKESSNTRLPSSLHMLLTTPTNTIHHYWRKFDDAIMRPVFGGRGFAQLDSGSSEEASE
ncbi:sodium/hydrogen exchanger 1-like [Coffea arabica]|uniref:Sodium/hydrogen exchanger n=1 Tax=Coffea arabica TaxID=13443 RepID=A0A6P6V5R6_COFAR|nr:sodium/hydrogen exchanger 2-like [Coffea arabica]